MSKPMFISLAATLLLLVGAIAPNTLAREYFDINRFHVDINIHENNSIVVTETITVTFNQQRHGIYREIPYKYKNELGDIVRMPIEVLEVKKSNSEAWDYKVSHEGNIVNVRIGHPNIFVRGRQTYIITYRVDNALMFFDDYDELYWNVTGNYWDAPIEQASATVTIVSDRESNRLATRCYTGYYGRGESDCSTEQSGNTAGFATTRPLEPREGLSVAVSWDKGIVRPPSAWQRFVTKYNLAENWVFIIPIVVLIFMVTQWYRKGRDPRVLEAVTVMYEPPRFNGKDLSAAEVGSLVDERMDPRDLTAAIIGLAVKGYMKIEEFKKEGLIDLFDTVDYRLHKLKEPDSELSSFESRLMDALFSGSARTVDVSKLKNKFYKNLKSLRETLWSDLMKKKFFDVSPAKVRGAYVGMGIAFIVLGALIAHFSAEGLAIRGVGVSIISGAIVLAFSNAMPVKTRAGARACFHILGFQEFMNRADKDRLERMGKDIFYKYMPYAIALDVVDHWAEAFEGLAAEPPQWYVSPHGFRAFSAVSFSRSIGVASSSLSTATYSAPRGSGSRSGGGFSGGGGGGGGGGSW